MKQADIFRRLKFHRTTLSAIAKRCNGKKSFKRVETRGRKYCVNEGSLCLLKSYVRKICFQAHYAVTTKSVENTGITVSVSTLRKCLHRLKLNSYMAVLKPFLKPQHIKARLEWARSYSKWDHSKWSQASFSDESSFVVCSSKKGMQVWRKKNERFLLQHCSPTFKSGYDVVPVLGAFQFMSVLLWSKYLRI